MAMSASVLLVEDEPLIAMLVEDMLDDTEFSIVAEHRCNKDALLWLAENTPDLAIVDLTLSDGVCLPVIDALKAAAVPLIVATGHFPDEFPEVAGLPSVAKPFRLEELLETLRKVSASSYGPKQRVHGGQLSLTTRA